MNFFIAFIITASLYLLFPILFLIFIGKQNRSTARTICLTNAIVIALIFALLRLNINKDYGFRIQVPTAVFYYMISMSILNKKTHKVKQKENLENLNDNEENNSNFDEDDCLDKTKEEFLLEDNNKTIKENSLTNNDTYKEENNTKEVDDNSFSDNIKNDKTFSKNKIKNNNNLVDNINNNNDNN